MLNPASDDGICGLTHNGCCYGDRERDRTTGGKPARVMLDATAKSSKEHAGKTTGAGVWSLPERGGSARALEG